MNLEKVKSNKKVLYGVIVAIIIVVAAVIFFINSPRACEECGQKEKLSSYVTRDGTKEYVCDYCKNMMKMFNY